MATTVFNTGGGSWKAANTWKSGTVPTLIDNVVLNFFALPHSTYRVNLDGDATVQDLTILDHNTLHLFESGNQFGGNLTANQVLIGSGGIISGNGRIVAEGIHNGGTIESTSFFPLIITTATPFVNSGKLLAIHGNLNVRGDLENSGTAHSAEHTMGLGNVVNSGELVASGFAGKIVIDGTLDNSKHIAANGANHGKATIEVHGSTVNSGTVVAHGDFFKSQIEFFASVTNSDQMKADHAGGLVFDAGVTNKSGGQLIAANGGTIDVHGAATGGRTVINGLGSVVTFDGSATLDTTTNVVFENGGKLVLDHSANYAGSVSSFRSGDFIDVLDVKFVAGHDSFNAQTDVLTIRDGIHTAKIQLVGSFTANDFAFQGDGHGGTLIVGL